MKSVLSGNCCKKEEKPFPKLMIHASLRRVVLFKEARLETVMTKGKGDQGLGAYFDDWIMSCYEDYEGDVCLTND